MGILNWIPEKIEYECSKCGSHNCKKFVDPPKEFHKGHDEGIRCLDCGHESRHYVKSIWEEECSSSEARCWPPKEPIKF